MSERRAELLVVDDEASVVDYLDEMLTEEGYGVTGCTDPHEALRKVTERPYDLVIADVEMPGLRGTELMAAIFEERPDQLVLLITAFGSIDLAVRTVKGGACDFVTKPFRLELLLLAIERSLREHTMRREIVRLRSALADTAGEGNLVARSPSMQRALSMARRAARSDAIVLVTGESGVGKGALARYIHDQSPRKGAFVEVNCAALPATLVEAELFGARRGAFTDARQDRPGLFSRAGGGSLFLDEIAEMPLSEQPKLLHAIESGRVRPVGGATEVTVDTRIIAATNRQLEDAVQSGSFRRDLYYRLNVVRIEVPPLRDRPEDLPPLVDVLLERACRGASRSLLGISAEALRWILAQPWPGNVRELSNAIERAVVLAEHDTIVLDDVRPPVFTPLDDDTLAAAARRGAPLAEVERLYIDEVLTTVDGNKAEAARILGIDRRTLYRRLEE